MEKFVVNEYLDALSDKWDIHEEIYGNNILSGKRKRIDAVIISKELKDKRFGIEFKKQNIGAFNNFTHWFKQAIIYSQTEWDGFGKLPILISPEIKYSTIEAENFYLTRLVGEFGIGILKKRIIPFSTSYRIEYKSHRVWCTDCGWNKVYINANFDKYLEL